jgi:superfamily II DNA or RNA helicase
MSTRNVVAVVAESTEKNAEEYEVDLVLDGNKLIAFCGCSLSSERRTVCKHIWASILEAEARGFGRNARTDLRLTVGDAYDDDFSQQSYAQFRSSVYQKPPVQAAPVKTVIQDAWKSQLAALSREIQPSHLQSRTSRPVAERQLVFVVDVAASEQAKKLVLELNLQERKRNNEWGKPKAQHLSHAQIETWPNPLDRQILSLLGGAERGDSLGYYGGGNYSYGAIRYRLAGALLEAVLPLLTASGRVRLRRYSQPPLVLDDLTANLDPPWQLRVRIHPDRTKKKLVLTGTLERGEETMSLSETVLLVPGLVFWKDRFARLEDGGSFSWVPVLRRVGKIEVPIKRADEFLGELLQLPGLPKLELAEELRYTEQTVAPKPRLLMKPGPKYSSGSVLFAELSFDYAGEIIPAQHPGRGIFRADGKQFLVRDSAAEASASQLLPRLGFRPGWSNQEPTLELKAALLAKVVRELTAAGWQVEAEGKLYRQASDFKLSVHTEQDWFDLQATAHFDGQPVPLPRLLAALKRGESSIILDDGSVGMVPQEWLKKYGLLARMGTIEGDQVRFTKTQVGVLDALLASRPEVTFDEQFGQARDRLRQFEGINPAPPAKTFRGKLRGYQCEGLGWMHFLRTFGFGGCLADDMGLGKTVQVLAMLAEKQGGPALVVVPRSLVFNWKQEAAKFAPDLKVLDHTGQNRDKTGTNFKDYDLILTTYGTLRNDAPAFAAYRFDTCVLDESQAAKNAETETAKAVRLINADHRLALSGTPVENHLGELWTLFDFLNPGMLGRAAAFGGLGSPRNPDPETREILAKALRPFILRRTKDQVAKDLPAKTEQTVYCDLDADQRKLYDELRDHYRQSLLARVDKEGLGRSKIQVLEALLRLRQAACHPGLIDKKRTGESSAKLDILLPQLKELAESGRKALVFSQFTSLLAILRAKLDAEGITYEYLDGRTRDRSARVERFQTDSDCRLFLVSLKAGGVGLNLTAAEYVFLLDPWWNPAVEAQAIDRSHRIGQTKPVFAYRLIARGTVEEKVLALQKSKRELADAILNGTGSLITDLKREDLELLLS